MIDNQRLATTLRSFAAERDWDQFHTPKNLAISISRGSSRTIGIVSVVKGTEGLG